MLCVTCQKPTGNPKFCSRSCAAAFNNKAFPKKKLIRKCVRCANVVKSYRHQLCSEHWEEYKNSLWKNKTIGEYRNKLSVKGKHKSWANAHIRHFAQSWFKKERTSCESCGYDKHVHLAHIKAVSTFPDTALLSEVNARENIRILCPNCHWEFDNLPRT